jgi:hypothetical protein
MVEIVHKTLFSSVEVAIDQMKKDHPGTYAAPWWGDKFTDNIKNRGYVIGWKDNTKNARWRLDYDNDKRLHINWVQDVTGSEQKKECYKINALNFEQTMFDYYAGWTKPRYDEIPQDIKTRLGESKIWYGTYWA